MAGYSTTLPPVRVAGAVAGPSLWLYSSATDARSVVIAAGYISNADDLGMKVGDFVLSYEVDTGLGTLSVVTVVASSGSTMVAMVLS